MAPLTQTEFNKYLEDLFQAPPIGTERFAIFKGIFVRFKQGIPGSLEVKDEDGPTGDEFYRQPNDKETILFSQLFNS